MILRRWCGVIRTHERDAYRDYIAATGGNDYAATPGNRGFQMLFRDLGDGTTEVNTLSWWESLDHIRGFAGDDIGRAVFYPEDDEYLIDRETTVTHHEVARRLG